MRWPWQRQPEAAVSIGDPSIAELFTPGGTVDLASIAVGETEAMGLSAMFRALSLVSGTLGSLPLRSWRDAGGEREKVGSIFDDPDPDGQTPFEWKETLFLHLLIHGKAGAIKQRTAAGGLQALPLVHPLAFVARQPSLGDYQSGRLPAGGLWFDVLMVDGQTKTFDGEDFWYVPAAAMRGQMGGSLLRYARRSLATTIAGDKAAAKLFDKGALISGIATPADVEEQDLTGDVPEIRKQINRAVAGYDNAGTIAVIARRLKFTPWTMTAQQAQFLESRQFQIEEISRWTGVPPHLLMQTEKQTSWGTGVDEQNRGLSKFVLGHWAQRVEQRASRLLANPRWCEFDFAGLERPNFETLVGLVVSQMQAGLISPKYGRELLNIPESAAPEPAPAPDPAPDPNQGGDGNAPPAQ